jgi:hypothetical protein
MRRALFRWFAAVVIVAIGSTLAAIVDAQGQVPAPQQGTFLSVFMIAVVRSIDISLMRQLLNQPHLVFIG